jgi:hypothetical protein
MSSYGKRTATSPRENMAKNPKNVDAQLSYPPQSSSQPSQSSQPKHETSLDLLVKLEFLTINGKPFLGQISDDELLYVWVKVFNRCLDEVFGVTSTKTLTRNVRATFKLKTPIKLNEAFGTPNFSYEKFSDDGSSEVITGKILGFIQAAQLGELVTVSVKTGFGVEASGVVNWLKLYGSVTPRQEFAPAVLNNLQLKSDTFQAEVVLRRHIEEYLPMYGQKVQVYYPGIPRQCNRCYGVGHMRRDCNNIKKDWIIYVKEFVENGVEVELIGTWQKAIERWQNANKR